MSSPKAKISFNFYIDNDLDLDALRFEVRDILHQTSDYWHDAIASYVDGISGELIINTYPGDLRDLARSRKLLKDAFELIINKTT